MRIDSTSHTALTAIQAGIEKADRAAEEIAKLSVSADEVGASESRPADLAKAIVSLKEAQFETQAGAKLVSAADELLGVLLDVNA